jgi:hypothetical protein
MEFKFDKLISRSNNNNHGIDFQEAQLLWHDLDRIEDKPSYLVISNISLEGKALLSCDYLSGRESTNYFS